MTILLIVVGILVIVAGILGYRYAKDVETRLTNLEQPKQKKRK